MSRLGQNILWEIFTFISTWPELVRLVRVCKEWKRLIQTRPHHFTLQGCRQIHLTPANANIRQFLLQFPHYTFISMDLRNIKVQSSLLSTALLSQPNLLKLDLTNARLDINALFCLMVEHKSDKNYKLKELRLTNQGGFHFGYKDISTIYPNLIKLYIGNTFITILDLSIIIEGFKQLLLLDISNSPIRAEDLQNFLIVMPHNSLQVLFYHQSLPDLHKILQARNIKLIGSTIKEILQNVGTIEDLHSVKEWLQQGGDVNLLKVNHGAPRFPGEYSIPEIIYRLENDDLLIETFKLLIVYNLDLSYHFIYNNIGSTMLSLALKKDNTKLAFLLMRCNSDVYPKFNDPMRHDNSLLTLAAATGNLLVLKELVSLNIESIIYSPQHCNPVCAAATGRKTEAFLYLVSSGFILFPCAYHKNIFITCSKILEYILQHNNSNQISLTMQQLYETMKLYINNKSSKKAAILIEHYGHEICNYENEVFSVANQSEDKKTIMFLAVEKGFTNIVVLLGDIIRDIDIIDDYGWSLFMCACAHGKVEIMKYLYGKGARIQTNFVGNSGMHLAAKNGHIEAVEWLIEIRDSGFFKKNWKGEIPLDLALANNRTEIIKIMERFITVEDL